MNEEMSSTPSPMPEEPRKSKTWIVILIGVLVLCCFCVIAAWAAWTYGDQVVQMLGLAN